ncbi:hypothetical protein RKD30_004801 [Streptomyces pristinaespiralis]
MTGSVAGRDASVGVARTHLPAAYGAGRSCRVPGQFDDGLPEDRGRAPGCVSRPGASVRFPALLRGGGKVAGRRAGKRGPAYLSPCRRTISVIQVGANGDVQPGDVG